MNSVALHYDSDNHQSDDSCGILQNLFRQNGRKQVRQKLIKIETSITQLIFSCYCSLGLELYTIPFQLNQESGGEKTLSPIRSRFDIMLPLVSSGPAIAHTHCHHLRHDNDKAGYLHGILKNLSPRNVRKQARQKPARTETWPRQSVFL